MSDLHGYLYYIYGFIVLVNCLVSACEVSLNTTLRSVEDVQCFGWCLTSLVPSLLSSLFLQLLSNQWNIDFFGISCFSLLSILDLGSDFWHLFQGESLQVRQRISSLSYNFMLFGNNFQQHLLLSIIDAIVLWLLHWSVSLFWGWE